MTWFSSISFVSLMYPSTSGEAINLCVLVQYEFHFRMYQACKCFVVCWCVWLLCRVCYDY